MPEYISREAAKKTACSLCRWEGTENCEECEHPIDDIPAADVRPVVFCKDCKYWELSRIASSFHICTYVCGSAFVRVADDFCSRGEKREKS